MSTMIRKWGNSLGVRIPKVIAEQAQLSEGSEVEFDTSAGVLRILPKRKRKYTLRQLMARAKGPNPHGEIDRSGPRGREMI
jgi:antitoxin MazE